MNSTKEQVLTFLEKCDELKKCKFIMATSKIKDILKCIVNSPELYKLFESVTKDFDYAEQKSKCLVNSRDGLNVSYVSLPQTIGQRLAFIFCLLVEFDRDTLNFNNFLQVYYHEDGSFFESYQAFCGDIICSLEEMIKHIFKERLADTTEVIEEINSHPDANKALLISSVLIEIQAEKEYVLLSQVTDEEKEGAVKILTALESAVKRCDEELIDSLIFGYNYFILYNKCVSDGVEKLIVSIAELEEVL